MVFGIFSNSVCNVTLNAATFSCQVWNSELLALRRRTPRHWRYKWKSLQTSLYSVLNAMLSLSSDFVRLFAVRSADQLRRWRYSSADTFSRIECSRACHRQRRRRGLGARAQPNSCSPKPGRARRAARIANGYCAHWNKETAFSGNNGRSLLS